MLREALEISRPLALVSREVPRFHGGSLWHSTPVLTTNISMDTGVDAEAGVIEINVFLLNVNVAVGCERGLTSL